MKAFRLIFLVLIGVSLAQCSADPNEPLPKQSVAPRLDSIAIDESAHELLLFGEFDSIAELTVLCDSISLQILTRNHGSIHVSIPDSGKGSCGWVTVGAGGSRSDSMLLSYWHFSTTYKKHHRYSNGDLELDLRQDTIYLRGDALSAYLENRSLTVQPVKLSRYSRESQGNGHDFAESGIPGELFRINLHGSARGIIDPITNRLLAFNARYELISYDEDYYCESVAGGTCDHGGPLTPTKFAPKL